MRFACILCLAAFHGGGAQLDDLTFDTGRLAGQHESLDCVAHKRQVSLGGEIPEVYFPFARQQLNENRGQDRPH